MTSYFPVVCCRVQYVRVDTYQPKWHLVDVTLEMSLALFNKTSVQLSFLDALRDLLPPWHVKMAAFRLYKEKWATQQAEHQPYTPISLIISLIMSIRPSLFEKLKIKRAFL